MLSFIYHVKKGVHVNDIASTNHPPTGSIAGFTLIELIVSITILTILLVLTLPAFQAMLMNNRILAETDALAGVLNFARNTAVSKNISVAVCPFSAANSITCGGSWQNGWIVVSQPAGAATLLQSKISGTNAPMLSSGVTTVTFDARGIATTQANFKICDNRGGAFAQSIKVLPTGFVQAGTTMGVAVWDGSALTCP